ncbi:hypothetical protein [Streptomyces sp. BA2]|uniref:hypothetical protein n=1 Tax=Streptomyces sp. BA2 TaxID=436595 RepID=UPI00132C84CF|nr:hypothetical protein [Streptomyces sp. BA2]MWA07798.1 hypothetical protein [Streptomyces sp. BA2]
MTITRHREQSIEAVTIQWLGGSAVDVIAWTGSGNSMTFDAERGTGAPDMSAAVYDELDSARGAGCKGQHIVGGAKGELCSGAGDGPAETYEAVSPPQSTQPCARRRPVLPDDVKVIAGLARGHALGQVCDDLSKCPRARHCSRRQLTHRLSPTGHPQPSLVDYLYRYAHLRGPVTETRPQIGRPAHSLDARTRGLFAGETGEGMRVSSDIATSHWRHALLEARSHTHAVDLGWDIGLLGHAQPPKRAQALA